MTMDEMVIAIRVTADGVAEIIGDVKDEIDGVREAADKIRNDTGDAFEPMTRGAEEAAVAQAALATAAAATFAKITEVVQTSTDAYNAYVAATQGLQSVAAGRGIGEEEMSKALEKVTDGFFSARAAAQAYKNLLSRGFTLDQATQTLERLKDAAAFGRAANLSLEDAVVSATEGIKNENSVLVDNAGVTKNVAKMWEDYAKARNLTTANLTQAQKVEAEYLGIITETQMQMGDLAKASDTLAGAQAENAATATQLSVTYGSALAPAMQAVTETSTGLLGTLDGLVSAAPEVASGITGAAYALAAMVTVMSGAKAAMSLISAGTIALNPAMVALAAGVGVATTAYTAYKNKQEEFAKAEEEEAKAAQAEREAREAKVSTLTSQIGELQSLGREFETLASKETLTANEQERIERIIGILTSQYGIAEASLRDLAGGYDSGSDAIADRIRYLDEERRALVETQIEQDKMTLSQLEATRAMREAAVQARLDVAMSAGGMFEGVEEFGADNPFADWKLQMNAWLDLVRREAPEAYEEMYAASREWLGAIDGDTRGAMELYDAFIAQLRGELAAIGAESAEVAGRIEENQRILDEGFETEAPDKTYQAGDVGANAKAAAQSVTEQANAATEALRRQAAEQEAYNAQLRDTIALMSDETTELEKQAAAKRLQEAGYGWLLGDEQGLISAKGYIEEQMVGITEATQEAAATFAEAFAGINAAFESGEISAEEYYSLLGDMYTLINDMPDGIDIDVGGIKTLGKEAKTTTDTIKGLEKSAGVAGKKLEDSLDFRSEIRSMKELARQVKDSGGGWEDLSDEVRAFAGKLGIAEGDVDGTIAALEAMESQTDASIAALESDLRGTLGTLEAMRAEIMAIPEAELTANNSQALAAINEAIAFVNYFLSLLGQAGIEPVSTGKRGGGGGGRKKDTSAEDAAREAERRQEEAYRKAIEAIEHKRHLNEITAQEEIEELERVKREYAKTADQIMDIDERIYDARQDLRRDEEGKISTLYDSIVDALEARYEEQREIEQRRINDSISAWEKWSDDTCAAIQKQIDALDDQIEAEDRAATEAEHLRKIASIEQAIDYEKDAYNQQQLLKQLEEAQKAWAEIQKGWAQDDQRKALEDQMQAVQDRADAEIEALEKESERIDSVYDEMLKGQSLAAEAQKLLMESTQEDLLALLTSYAPDYEATGRTLGEKIFEGFKSAFGDVSAFFESIDAQFEQMADRAQSAAFGKTQGLQASGQAAATVTAPTINQTVNFNQPVESPADVTRRMQQVSEELAGMM